MTVRTLLLGLLVFALGAGADGLRLLPGELPQPSGPVPVEVVEVHERAEAEVSDARVPARPRVGPVHPSADVAGLVSQATGVPPVPPPEA